MEDPAEFQFIAINVDREVETQVILSRKMLIKVGISFFEEKLLYKMYFGTVGR